MKTVHFYTTDQGKTPVVEFLDSLTANQAQKVTWVLQLIEELLPLILKSWSIQKESGKCGRRWVITYLDY